MYYYHLTWLCYIVQIIADIARQVTTPLLDGAAALVFYLLNYPDLLRRGGYLLSILFVYDLIMVKGGEDSASES